MVRSFSDLSSPFLFFFFFSLSFTLALYLASYDPKKTYTVLFFRITPHRPAFRLRWSCEAVIFSSPLPALQLFLQYKKDPYYSYLYQHLHHVRYLCGLVVVS